MNLILTIGFGIGVVLILLVGVRLMILVNAFEELLARFVEMNSNYYKSQQHSLGKLDELKSDQKKLSSTVSNLKRTIVKIDTSVSKINNKPVEKKPTTIIAKMNK